MRKTRAGRSAVRDLVDLGMSVPDIGWPRDLCRDLRNAGRSKAPILMLTGHAQRRPDNDHGLERGAREMIT